MERSRTEHADEISDLEQARSRLEAEISLEIAARNESEDRLGAVEAEAEALREEVDSLRKVESMAIEGVERLEDQVDDMLRGCGGSLHCIMHSPPPLPHQVDEAEARCERAEGELRAKVAEAVEARGRAARSEDALQQQQQSAAAKETEGGVNQREQQAREAKLREEVKLAKREIEMMQEMVISTRDTKLGPAFAPTPSPCPSPTPVQPSSAPSRRALPLICQVGAAQGHGESAAARVAETLRTELRQEQQRRDTMGQAQWTVYNSAPRPLLARRRPGPRLAKAALTHPRASATVREGSRPHTAPRTAPRSAPRTAGGAPPDVRGNEVRLRGRDRAQGGSPGPGGERGGQGPRRGPAA